MTIFTGGCEWLPGQNKTVNEYKKAPTFNKPLNSIKGHWGHKYSKKRTISDGMSGMKDMRKSWIPGKHD